MFPSIYARNQSKCTFDLKGKFATDLEVALARNQVHASQLPTVPSERDYWLKQPPDFSYKLYITPGLFSKPLGKSKELKKKMSPSTLYEELHRIRSRLFAPVVEQKEESKIVTRFPHVDPYEAQLMFVKKGKYKSSKYQDPKPFDYRQYESGIPNFVTSYARDPLNLKFKAQCLSKVHGLHPLTEEKRGPRSKEKFITCKPQELKWDSKLLLPKEPWPAKPVSFTRHKSQQSAHSAFIERVEETLSKLWLKEATKKEAQSRRKAAYRSKQKMQSAAVSIERDFEMEQQASRPQEKSRQKGQLSPSLSIAVQGQGLPVHIKPEPLGFLLPNGIAQSVEELRCK
ncbi:uncharacterized protein LOC133365106 [Rhineura floridana]|uniref:uncharacterized protein LOC133365106 n=1 Tax=Rhineura floridana TaxID=261503 RepID=UPI002AC7E704|nr:uncharacterized protein LOC133365106 [Rhineura floridana]